MIVIETMDKLPESCFDCHMNQDGRCCISKNEKGEYGHQSAQEFRPFNCPLKEEFNSFELMIKEREKNKKINGMKGGEEK